MDIINLQLQFWHQNQPKSYDISTIQNIEDDLFSIEIEEDIYCFTVHLIPKEPIVLQNIALHIDRKMRENEKVFVNGYQTWTDSREFMKNEHLQGLNPLASPVTNRFRMSYYGDYYFYNYPKEKGTFHSYTYTYFRKKEHIELWASLSEESGFTIFETYMNADRMIIRKDCQNLELSKPYTAFKLFYKKGKPQEVWDTYLEASNLEKAAAKNVSGWTSWYHHYTKIDEKTVLENLAAFQQRNIPIDLFQIDDGYQQAVGDWMPNEKFPNGMRSLTDQIHDAGYKAGLWIAPLICEEKSEVRKNTEWLLKDQKGLPLPIGFSPDWSGKFYALDFGNQQVKNYLRETFRRLLDEWNFDMLKLDFLHAAAIVPPPHQTRGQVMCEAMQFLREIAGDKLLLGCGVPLGSALGQVDYCRIGADVALKWEDNLLKNRLRYRERVSTKCSLNSTIGRHALNGRFFLNDPDVFILREENNTLTFPQKYTLFLLNQALGGLLFTSDNLDTYDEKTLRLYQSQFPLLDKKKIVVQKDQDLYKIRFEIGDKHYLLCANLSDKGQDILLPEGKYFRAKKIVSYAVHLAPFQSVVYKKVEAGNFEILGSNGHLFPGADVEVFTRLGDDITLERHPQSLDKATVYLSVPELKTYLVNGQSIEAKEELGRVIVEVEFGEEMI